MQIGRWPKCRLGGCPSDILGPQRGDTLDFRPRRHYSDFCRTTFWGSIPATLWISALATCSFFLPGDTFVPRRSDTRDFRPGDIIRNSVGRHFGPLPRRHFGFPSGQHVCFLRGDTFVPRPGDTLSFSRGDIIRVSTRRHFGAQSRRRFGFPAGGRHAVLF